MIYILRKRMKGEGRGFASMGSVVKICLRFPRKEVGPAGPSSVRQGRLFALMFCSRSTNFLLITRAIDSKNSCLHDLSYARDARTKRMLVRETRDSSIETLVQRCFHASHTHSFNFVFYRNNNNIYREFIRIYIDCSVISIRVK